MFLIANQDLRTIWVPFALPWLLDMLRIPTPLMIVSSTGTTTVEPRTLQTDTTCSTELNGAPDQDHTQRTHAPRELQVWRPGVC
jgi:hypothetical protein